MWYFSWVLGLGLAVGGGIECKDGRAQKAQNNEHVPLVHEVALDIGGMEFDYITGGGAYSASRPPRVEVILESISKLSARGQS